MNIYWHLWKSDGGHAFARELYRVTALMKASPVRRTRMRVRRMHFPSVRLNASPSVTTRVFISELTRDCVKNRSSALPLNCWAHQTANYRFSHRRVRVSCISVCLSVRTCNSKTIAPIDLIILRKKYCTHCSVRRKYEPDLGPDLDSWIYLRIFHHWEIGPNMPSTYATM